MRSRLFIIPSFALVIFSGCSACISLIPASPQQVVQTAAGQSYGIAVEKRTTGAIVSDKKIVLKIEEKFAEDSPKKILDISPFCYNGQVFLIGEYDTPEEKDRAVEIAEHVEGVQSITTFLLLKNRKKSCGTADDLAIHVKVRAKLVADIHVRSTNIDIKVVQCRVVLLGILGSPEEIDHAVADAGSVEGVEGVESFLEAQSDFLQTGVFMPASKKPSIIPTGSPDMSV